MDSFTALLLVLGLALMQATYGSPVCNGDCRRAERYHHQNFKLQSHDLSRSSVAPWTWGNSSEEGREPQFIQYAVCQNCQVENMVAKPIYLLISVYQRVGNGTNEAWCRCPYKLAVGCTCVRKQ